MDYETYWSNNKCIIVFLWASFGAEYTSAIDLYTLV